MISLTIDFRIGIALNSAKDEDMSFTVLNLAKKKPRLFVDADRKSVAQTASISGSSASEIMISKLWLC